MCYKNINKFQYYFPCYVAILIKYCAKWTISTQINNILSVYYKSCNNVTFARLQLTTVFFLSTKFHHWTSTKQLVNHHVATQQRDQITNSSFFRSKNKRQMKLNQVPALTLTQQIQYTFWLNLYYYKCMQFGIYI
jgi:hypothetical protein